MNKQSVRRAILGAILLIAGGWLSSCIFAVDAPTDTARDTGSGPVDAGEAGSLDAGECLFQGNSEGVCMRGRLVADGADVDVDGSRSDGAVCAPPSSYEPDETTCDGLDNDCDGVTDEGCDCDALGRSEGVCSSGTVSEEDGECIPPESYETDETSCDGKDNDCDGETDENCFCAYKGQGKGVCVNGRKNDDGECTEPDAYVETETDAHCDGKDNDCDGSVDEQCDCAAGASRRCYTGPSGTAGTGICERGSKTCTSDGWPDDCSGETTPSSDESCNGKDDDCDGVTDEGCDCDYTGTGDGVCSNGTITSDGNCEAPVDYEVDETSCDNKDNDCDGVTDENCSCNYNGTSTGVCSDGTIDPSTGNCTEPADYESTERSCDSRDNDCDGLTDSDDPDLSCMCSSGETTDCYTGPSGTEGVGICESGTKTCQSDDTWGDCEEETTPDSEGSGGNCDGKDNDCDGYTDEGCTCNYDGKSTGVCEDQTRDSEGNCPVPNGYEDPESTCSDGLDNDCDGDADCADVDCSGDACGTGSGAVCATGVCTEQDCNDGIDNDLNDGTDCADSDCAGEPCGTESGAECQNGTCTELECGDGVDNDQDGKTDCEDPECGGSQCNGSGTTCVSGDSACHETVCTDGVDNDGDGETDVCDSDCSASCGSGASCSKKESGTCSEIDCGNGKDDDEDGDTDCADSDCSTCGSGTTCSGDTCVETNCSDGVDNDGDGDTDCADSDCAGKACGTGSGAQCRNQKCVETACEDTKDNDQDGLTDTSEDSDDCDRSGLEWCVDDTQCAVGVCTTADECAQTIVATSTTYPDGALGGASGADTKCQNVAGGARPGTWKAIVSASNSDANDRLTVSSEVYNASGTRVAKGSSDLWDGDIENPVEYDETGTAVTGQAWTGTDSSGALSQCSINSSLTECTCTDWNSSGNLDAGTTGRVTKSDGAWVSENDTACSTQGIRLYCIDGQ